MAKWLKQHLPHAHLIVMLRDPIKRAISHHAMLPNQILPHSTFDEMIACLLPKMQSYYTMMQPWNTKAEFGRPRPSIPGFEKDSPSAWDAMPTFLRKSPIGRGLYSEQLVSYFSHFPREQVHVHFSEHLFAGGNSTKFFTRLTAELGLPYFDWRRAGTALRVNPSFAWRKPRFLPNATTVANLKEFFRPFNKQLSMMLGVDVSKVWGEY